VSGLDDDGLRAAYSGAAAFVYPSLQEGFGIPLLEAMGCGTPIVASDIPVFREVADGVATFVDPYDQTDLLDALLRTLSPDAGLAARVDRGIARAREFTWARAAEQLAGVYARVAQ
jgi:glycosyltransferase involved in cell wall biosynthesis